MQNRGVRLVYIRDGKPRLTMNIPDEWCPAIGRDAESNHVALHGREVSRTHARIMVRDGEYFILDMGSKDGTYVNRQLVDQEAKLEDGDEIRIGRHRLIFTPGIGGLGSPETTVQRGLKRCPRPGCPGGGPRNAGHCMICGTALE